MKLHQLPSTTTPKSKRLGRGYGSGKGGHTASRGQKGQKSRSSVPLWFEGGQLPLTKKIPFLRGKDRFKSYSRTTLGVNLSKLAAFPANATVSPQTLAEQGIISLSEAASCRIKILATGELNHPLAFENLLVSAAAAKKITSAGGALTLSDSPNK